MKAEQFTKLKALLARVEQHSPFYQNKFKAAGLAVEAITTPADIVHIPFTTKEELREAYPLNIQAVPDEEIVRIHSSSGTTGKPIIIPYTARDVADWAEMMRRCMAVAELTAKDRVQITPGYGLWTAGIGFQAGVERLGAMAIPMGPGNTEKQLQMMMDLESTVITATSSYALLLAEEIRKRGLKDRIKLRKAILGSERWGDKMRTRIREELGVELYDIYGLTEIYGPGISISCKRGNGLHYWDDYLLFEIINPKTGQPVADGEFGELVITTLTKEGAPLIRYRTRDITRMLPEECPCGMAHPRHDLILGRTDDMVKVKGVNIYPGQVEDVLKHIEGISSEYQIVLDREEGKDTMLLRFEQQAGFDGAHLERNVKKYFKTKVGISIDTQALAIGQLPRSEKKTNRVMDHRY
ncbi:phenylacetate--CoA ligase family protein [Sporomusa acidovorans]|uniref:Phenylacetate-coenzyme A ligase n=1 Tax=Sporomusa acidovorans (strain ATCC 49682 / DSM 3132 / Mol) TaxID=1123286 RepID=A0ABZ3J3U6_SPOA4|nr:phenylacetate--CoA ligase [Sporomusa acidovorans]OZC23098.1 phenylacetate-coenzyme A ligase [Sporomusa acidovorans DSM 3132]SDF05371.1 phenylacetate-CoA ligase [Sporomusa acidovorans]